MMAVEILVSAAASYLIRGMSKLIWAPLNYHHRRMAMIKGTLMLMLTVAALSLGFALFAAQEPKQEPGSQDTPQMVEATILQVDTAGNSVTVQTTDNRKGTLKVDSETKITVSGKKAKLSDLKQGQQAKIAFNGQGKALSIAA
jgi:Cu/Ag efflux protein CusF